MQSKWDLDFLFSVFLFLSLLILDYRLLRCGSILPVLPVYTTTRARPPPPTVDGFIIRGMSETRMRIW